MMRPPPRSTLSPHTTLSRSNFNSTAGTATLVMSGGTLGGSGTFTVSGLTTWSGGTMSGSGVTNANGGLILTGALNNGREDHNTGLPTHYSIGYSLSHGEKLN